MNDVAAFDALAGDGLESEEPYYTPEEEREILANAKRAKVQAALAAMHTPIS